jgi:hypothetical protein
VDHQDQLSAPGRQKISAMNIVTWVDANTISWQSKDRTLDGKPLPDTKEMQLKRVK